MEIWSRRKGRVALCQYLKRTSQKHGRDKEYIYISFVIDLLIQELLTM
jgi:hypothetical protein